MNSLARAQANYDAEEPADYVSKQPSKAQTDEAFAELVQDSQLLADFINTEQPDYTTPFQLFHKYGGLPSMDGSERDDNIRDSWQITMDGFFDHYRDWLGVTLTDKAAEVMRAEIQAAKDEAAQARFDDREYQRNFG